MAVLEVNGLKKVYTTRFGGSRVQALKVRDARVDALHLLARLARVLEVARGDLRLGVAEDPAFLGSQLVDFLHVVHLSIILSR